MRHADIMALVYHPRLTTGKVSALGGVRMEWGRGGLPLLSALVCCSRHGDEWLRSSSASSRRGVLLPHSLLPTHPSLIPAAPRLPLCLRLEPIGCRAPRLRKSKRLLKVKGSCVCRRCWRGTSPLPVAVLSALPSHDHVSDLGFPSFVSTAILLLA